MRAIQVRSGVAIGTLFILGLAAGRAVGADAGPVDEPTAWACTAKTLDAATECYLEGTPAPLADASAQARENVQQAATLATRSCGAAARVGQESRPDGDLFPICQREFAAAAAESCALSDGAPLFDAKGRFSLDAKPCYQALATVLRRTRMMAALSASCCRCLVRKCAVEAAACHRELVDGDAPNDVRACYDKGHCGRECLLLSPSPAEPSEPAINRLKARGVPVDWL